jgi:hypothetical protein
VEKEKQGLSPEVEKMNKKQIEVIFSFFSI